MTKWTIKQLWDKACEYDRIPFDSKFVVFSDHNPWMKKYNFAISAYLKSTRTNTAYVQHDSNNNGQSPEFTR